MPFQSGISGDKEKIVEIHWIAIETEHREDLGRVLSDLTHAMSSIDIGNTFVEMACPTLAI